MAATRTTITIDKDLLLRVKTTAATKGRTLSDYISDSLRHTLAQEEAAPRTKRRAMPTYGRGGLQPGVNLDSSAALRDYLDELGEKNWP